MFSNIVIYILFYRVLGFFLVLLRFMTCLAKKYLIYDAKLISLKAKYRHFIQIKRYNESTFV